MISPFTRLNTAAMRAETAARRRARLTRALCLAGLAAAAVILGDAILTTALQFPDLTARAATMAAM